jgi:hypothetical protein
MIFKRFNKIIPNILFAVYPFLFFLANNPEEIHFGDLLFPAFITLAISSILFIWADIFLKDKIKASIIVSFLLLFFFSYGYVYDGLSGVIFIGIEIGRARYLLPVYFLLFLGGVAFIIFTKRALASFYKFLLASSVVLVSMSLFSLVPVFINKMSVNFYNSMQMEELQSKEAHGKRDIYYIILDAYANEHVLRDIYDYDNGDFLGNLIDKGFYVADRSSSNYAATHISLSSSLNMEYVNYLSEMVENGRDGFDPTRELISNSKVSQFLKNQGYAYVAFRSIWGHTDRNKYADISLQGGKFNELTMLLVNTSLLRVGLLYPPIYSYFLKDFRERILYTFDKLSIMPTFDDTSKPKFVFAHILAPHPPFMFGPNGEEVDGELFKLKPDGFGWGELGKKRYIDQLEFINKKTLETIDNIISKSEIPPIIIIQSDHGPWSTADEDRANNLLYKERMRILNAYFLPDIESEILYNSITPVNSFRVVFNEYFGAGLELLEDRIYFSDTVSMKKTPYKFIDVTDIVTDW